MATIGFGYGVDTTAHDYGYAPNAYASFLKTLSSVSIKEAFAEFASDHKDTTDESELIDMFVDEWEDESGRGCFEQMIAQSINENELANEDRFFYEDYCIYYASYIPADAAEKAKMLTQEDIRRLLAKYLNPIIQRPVTVEFLEIRE